MATAALTNPELRIIPLAEANLASLESMFDEQCEEWSSLFRWDYTGPSRLIREVARQRELLGFAATAGDAMIGFAFYVVEGSRCSIGDIYVSKTCRGLGADRQMAAAILEKMDALPRLRRIESQCLSVGNNGANDLFLSRGFARFLRYYMMINLEPVRGKLPQQRRAGPEDIALRPWRDDDFAAAARIIHNSYRGEHDSLINSQYRTEDGCVEILSILMDHIWCGEFMPRISRVAVSKSTGRHVGILLALRIAPGAGHIGQISILPGYQGLGLGRRMIEAALADFGARGFKTVSLAVTATNTRACKLYGSCGFDTIHTFPAFYHERR